MIWRMNNPNHSPFDTLPSCEVAWTYWNEYNELSVSSMYSDVINPTGISHPVIITEINGDISVGDEVVAYADGMVVGATKVVDLDMPVVITAWGGYSSYDINLDGFAVGDAIDLRLYSHGLGKEVSLSTNLDYATYGESALSSGSVEMVEEGSVPVSFDLMQNYPNPFNPTTTISFAVPEAGHVSVGIYDITGRLVSSLIDQNMAPGSYDVTWDGTDLTGAHVSAGMYIYSLQAEGVTLTRKMVLMK